MVYTCASAMHFRSGVWSRGHIAIFASSVNNNYYNPGRHLLFYVPDTDLSAFRDTRHCYQGDTSTILVPCLGKRAQGGEITRPNNAQRAEGRNGLFGVWSVLQSYWSLWIFRRFQKGKGCVSFRVWFRCQEFSPPDDSSSSLGKVTRIIFQSRLVIQMIFLMSLILPLFS